MNILLACLKKFLNRGAKFSYMMGILHRIVWKTDLPRMRVALENLPFQQEVQIWSLLYENIFHFVNQRLSKDALDEQITWEDSAAFSTRVKTALELMPIYVMDITILSMSTKINEIIKGKNEKDRGLNNCFVFACKNSYMIEFCF